MTTGQTPSATRAPQLGERAYLALRERIVTLQLPPGTVLQEEELMRELELGRTPLREGIKRLALEHLLEIRPRRLTRVTGVSAADAARIGEVRVELEPQAARLAAERLCDELREHAETLAAELRGLDGADADQVRALDQRIHRLAWRAACNAYLETTLEAYFTLSLRLWHLVQDRVPSLARAVRDHGELLDALLSGDGERAAACMRKDVVRFHRGVEGALAAGS